MEAGTELRSGTPLTKYRKVIYRCNHKFDKDMQCGTPHFTEDEIKQMFITGVNKLLEDKDAVIEALESTIPLLCDNEELLCKQKELSDEITVIVELTQTAVAENARTVLDQEEYKKRYDGLVQRYNDIQGTVTIRLPTRLLGTKLSKR